MDKKEVDGEEDTGDGDRHKEEDAGVKGEGRWQGEGKENAERD